MKRLALLLIICITGAQASLIAEAVEGDQIELAGETQFMWIRDISDAPSLQITFTAEEARVEARSFTYTAADTSGNVGPVPLPEVPLPTHGLNPQWSYANYENIRANLTLAQSGSMFSIVGAMDGHMFLDSAALEGLETPSFDSSKGVSEEPQGSATRFRTHEFGEPLVLAELNHGGYHALLKGDLVLEMEYADFVAQSDQGEFLLQSSHDRRVTAPGIHEVTERFVRIHLTGAALEITSAAHQGLLQSLTGSSNMETENALRIRNATGSLGSLTLQGEDALIGAGTFHLAPTDGGIAMDQPKDQKEFLGLMSAPGTMRLAWLLTPLLRLPLLRRKPTLERMETAIEAGKYQKASKVASRLLRKNPFEERATMGYAVAQAKLGNHKSVVSHLQRWLKAQEPKDGIFHYVLGMSFMELGEEGTAREQFSSAIKLTPSLKGDVPSGPVVAEHAYA